MEDASTASEKQQNQTDSDNNGKDETFNADIHISSNDFDGKSSFSQWSSYLALIPRGLQYVTSQIVQEHMIDSSDGTRIYKYRIKWLGEKMETTEDERNNHSSNSLSDSDSIFSIATQQWNKLQEKKIQRKKKLKSKQPLHQQQRVNNTMVCLKPVGSVVLETTDMTNDFGNNNNDNHSMEHDGNDEIATTTSKEEIHEPQHLKRNGQEKRSQQRRQKRKNMQKQLHVSIGYDNTNYNNRQLDKQKDSVIWTCPGQLAGTVLCQIDTTAPASIVANIRCLGPLLALVTVSQDGKRCDGGNFSFFPRQLLDPTSSMKEATRALKYWIQGNHQYQPEKVNIDGISYKECFDRALRVWRNHVSSSSWRSLVSTDEYSALLERCKEMDKLSFRLSCVRDEPSDFTATATVSTKSNTRSSSSSKFLYTRQELLSEALEDTCEFDDVVMDCTPFVESVRKSKSSQAGSIVPSPYKESWAVNLSKFDLEVVLFVLPFTRTVAIGLSLRPYSFVKARSFSSGSLPPDLTPPYLGGDVLSGLVRLRPSTAYSLLHLAQIKPAEIVLDPCAGIGTIPLEADLYYKTDAKASIASSCGTSRRYSCDKTSHGDSVSSGHRAIGLGGDLVLNHPTIITTANALVSAAKCQSATAQKPNSTQKSRDGICCNLAAWDASLLPLRTGSIDVIVSDLPFGQQCLSTNALANLLPLIFSECARVLTVVESTSSTKTTQSLATHSSSSTENKESKTSNNVCKDNETTQKCSLSRMVLLCGGNHELVVKALTATAKYWFLPCTAMIPVNIGGLLAWIIRVERNTIPFANASSDSNQKHLDRVRKLTKKRDRISHMRSKEEEQKQLKELNRKETGLLQEDSSPNPQEKKRKKRSTRIQS